MSVRGFEPRTTWLKVKCSTTWATRPHFLLQGKCPEPESNQWHEDFQSSALPTELSGHTHNIMCELRGQDLNLRPSGYEPDELPDCSTPRYEVNSQKEKADDRTRTDNLLITNQLLCQLSHIGLHLQVRLKIGMDGGGFEPPKQFAADLQSVPFGHSGIHPCQARVP